MKTIESSKTDQMLPEYDFDYKKARPNRFASMTNEEKNRLIILDPDIAGIFNTSESVNKVLMAIIASIHRSAIQKEINHISGS